MPLRRTALWLVVAILFLACGPGRAKDDASPAAADSSTTDIENSVVKIFATQRLPDLYKPWSKSSPEDVTGSGVVIEGHRILTNAHVVEFANEVQIQANQAGDKIFATVEAWLTAILRAATASPSPKVSSPVSNSPRTISPSAACASR